VMFRNVSVFVASGRSLARALLAAGGAFPRFCCLVFWGGAKVLFMFKSAALLECVSVLCFAAVVVDPAVRGHVQSSWPGVVLLRGQW